MRLPVSPLQYARGAKAPLLWKELLLLKKSQCPSHWCVCGCVCAGKWEDEDLGCSLQQSTISLGFKRAANGRFFKPLSLSRKVLCDHLPISRRPKHWCDFISVVLHLTLLLCVYLSRGACLDDDRRQEGTRTVTNPHLRGFFFWTGELKTHSCLVLVNFFRRLRA